MVCKELKDSICQEFSSSRKLISVIPVERVWKKARRENGGGDSENPGTQGVLTGTPSHGGSGEQGQSGPYVQPMMMMRPAMTRPHGVWLWGS